MSLAERGNMYDKELHEVKKKVDKLLAHKTPQYKQGYNTAIDDFANYVKVEILPMFETEEVHDVAMKTINEIAEELKS